MSARHIAPIILIATVASMPSWGQEPSFSWKGFVGEKSDTLVHELSGIADCLPEERHSYRLKASPARVSVDNFSGWVDPTGGGLILNDTFYSAEIRTRSCKLGKSASVYAMVYQERIFSLNVRYHKCDFNQLNCEIRQSDADQKAYLALKEFLVVVPGTGTGKLSSDEYSEFVKYRDKLKALSLENPMNSAIPDCFFPRLNEVSWRCLVGTKQLGEIIQGFSFAEIDRSTLLSEEKDMIFASQSFANSKLEQEAELAFIEEVNFEIDRISAINNAEQTNQLRAKSVIESVE